MAKIFKPVTNKKGERFVVKMDLADYEKIKGPSIYCKVNRVGNRVYACQMINGRQVYIHRRIVAAKKGDVVDHVNNDSLDNSRKNLRVCSISQNRMNSKKRSDSNQKYKGVHKKLNRYRAVIGFNGKRINIGSFLTEEAAAIAYNKAALKYHGEYAQLNKINMEV